VLSKPRVRALVEIERNHRTISGQVTINEAPATEFYGWLELIDALERASRPRGVCAKPGTYICSEARWDLEEQATRSVGKSPAGECDA
jgi:hypothetical protein